MLEKGIAYRKTQVVNWDPVDQTVLANEQVIDGKGWRTGATVEKREIPGYYLKITDYAEELLDHTQHKLPGWPERVKLMQENWIGKSEGVRFAFTHDIKDDDGELIQDGRMYVFTTRADTIMGVTFCAVAPEHPLAAACRQDATPRWPPSSRNARAGGTTEAELAHAGEEGRAHRPARCAHPITDEPVPVWVGNYVLIGYGDGAVMGVPGARRARLRLRQQVRHRRSCRWCWSTTSRTSTTTSWQDWYADKERGVTINSDNFSGMTYSEAVEGGGACAGAEGPGRECRPPGACATGA